MTNTNEIKIFRSAWGWERTNITFYVAVHETAKTVILVKIPSRVYDLGRYVTKVVPDLDEAKKMIDMYKQDKKSVEAFRRGYKRGYATPTVRINECATASVWNGEPEKETTIM